MNRHPNRAPGIGRARILVAAAALAASTGAKADETSPQKPKRTLTELIELARSRSVTVAMAQSQVAIRESQKSEAVRNWAPTGEFTAAVAPTPEVECSDRPPGMPANPDQAYRQQHCLTTVSVGGDPTNSLSLQNIRGVGAQLAFTLTQPIYTFGKIEHGTAAAKYGIEAEKGRVEIARDEAAFNAARGYWGLKAARTSLLTIGDARDEVSGFVDKIQQDLDSDEPHYNVNDLQRIKIAVAQVDLVINDLQRNVLNAESGLKALIGEDTDIDDSELDPVEIVQHPIEYFQSEARTHRPEFRALSRGVSAMRELQKLKIAEMLPDLALVFSFTYRVAPSIDTPDNGFFNQANTTSVGLYLGLRQPLDILQRHARYMHARADADSLAATERASAVGIDYEIAQAHNNLVEARRRLGIADHGQHIAQGWLNAVKQNLDIGTAEPRDLIDAARNYYDLRLQYYRAIYDVNISIAQLRRSTGVGIVR